MLMEDASSSTNERVESAKFTLLANTKCHNLVQVKYKYVHTFNVVFI